MKIRIRHASSLLIASSLALGALTVGCTGTTNDALSADRERALRGADRYPNEGLMIVKADLNRDGIPDVYTVFKEGPVPTNARGASTDAAVKLLVRKEIDVNFDGSIDIWRHYNEAEKLIKEELDYNFDGRVDAINTFDRGSLVRKELDLEFDQAPDVFKHYKDGELIRVERDANNDGRVDYWEFYERGALDRIGTDTDGDGRADKWQER